MRCVMAAPSVERGSVRAAAAGGHPRDYVTVQACLARYASVTFSRVAAVSGPAGPTTDSARRSRAARRV